jgi:DNA-binding beta-propeller fold protein YncE/ABC-type Fe3+ transport system permease subunit
VLVCLVALLAAGVPLAAAAWLWATGDPAATPDGAEDEMIALAIPSPGGSPGAIAGRTMLWATGAAIAATLVGWLPGRRLGRALGLRRALIAVAVLLPVSIPAYAVYHAWWQAWPVGSDLHAWIVTRDLVPTARAVTLGVAFVAWAWPIVALCVAPAAAAFDRRRDDAMRLDRRGGWRRGLVAARAEAPAAFVGALVVLVMIAGNTTAFDLAQVYAIGNELRAMDALGRPAADMLAVAGPFMLLAVAGAMAAWRGGRPRRPRDIAEAGLPARSGAVASLTLTLMLLATVALPVVLTVRGVRGPLDVELFLRLNGAGLTRSLLIAATVAGLTAVLALAAGVAFAAGRRPAVTVGGGLLLLSLLVPGFILVAGTEAAWNRGWPGADPRDAFAPATLIYGTPAVLLLAGLARAAAPAILLARGAADGRRGPARELARLDAPRTIGGRIRELGPRLGGAAVAAAAIAFVLVLADATVVPRLAPPGFDPIAGTLLNAMHYQRADTVLLGLLVIVAAAGLAATGLALGSGIGRGGVRAARRRMTRAARATPVPAPGDATSTLTLSLTLAVLLPAALMLAGCSAAASDGDGGSDGVPPLPSPVVHGGSGTGPGQFSYPRAMTADPERGRLYVIDKTARVQVFDAEGQHIFGWRMPEFDQGKPTGISVGPDGTVWVADTHENRVMAFSPDGREQLRFGGPGTEPGQFIYTTDVAVGADGRLYVSEYGGNDRIQVFEPDGTLIRSIGAFGPGDDEFNRPQALLFSPDRTSLYVADSCNHRIVELDPETGRFLSVIGTAGTGPGEFHYPYEITWFDEDVLLVSEFGNNRIQLVRTDGTSLGRWGGVGAGAGQLKYPWSAVRVGGSVHVLDSGNNRLQQVPARRLR